MVPNLSAKALLKAATQLSPKLVEWRQHLHRNPELSFAETETQTYVEQRLDELGIPHRRLANTGVLATIEGARSGGCVAIRADLDALPIQEVAGRAYGSSVPGVMHACGHDVHTTCALGAAALLAERRDQLAGKIKVIFQPGEELLPGGATHVISDGALESPAVERIVALHVAPDIPVGSFGVRPGAYMASADEIYLTLKGSGGHGALAHRHIDLVATAAQMLTALQQVVSRKAPPEIATVLSFGKINSHGGATNVLTDRIDIAGTFRTYDETWRTRAHQWIEQICTQTAMAFGAQIEVDIRRGYPALSNDVATTSTVEQVLAELVGPGSEVQALGLRPTAEDFAWYLQKIPGCFFRLGVRNEARGITAGVHTASFDVDEACLPLGTAALASAAVAMLGADHNSSL